MKKILLAIFYFAIISIISCKKIQEQQAVLNEKMTALNSIEIKTNPSAGYFGLNLAAGEFGKIPGVYNKDYTYPTTGELDYYNSRGLKLIRLPFKWERLQPVMNGELDSTELARLSFVVEEAGMRGMLIVLDCHNYGRRNINGTNYIIGSPEVPIQSLKDFWTRMADVFKTKKEKQSNIWAYDIMNEPHDMLATAPWFNIAQETINGIRSTDLITNIIISGDGWSSPGIFGVPGSKSDVLKDLTDPSDKLIFQAHVYFDKNNSGTYQGTYESEEGYPKRGVDRTKPFINWLKANNKKGFIGEYGIPANDSRWLVVLDNFLKYIQENDVNGTYWAGGPWWGNYPLSVEPSNGMDKPQMEILQRYLSLIDFTILPSLTTLEITDISDASAISGGYITNEGDSKVKARGLCWSSIQNPTISDDTILIDAKDTGSFSGVINGLKPYTTYHIRAYAINKAGTAYGNNLTFRTRAVIPIVTTAALNNITESSADGGGEVLDEGESPVSERGVCWSITDKPTINDSKIAAGSGTGLFTVNISGLTTNTAYYLRAYATSSSGTGYGNTLKFITKGSATLTDIDGNVYNTVTIGDQIWMAENLKVTRYRNGDPIALVTGSTAWAGLSTGAYCWYNNDAAANGRTYGALYNWFAVNDSRNIAPPGWHVPTEAEREILDKYLGGASVAGGKLKEAGTAHWAEPNTGATNESGFTGLPAGYRVSSGGFTNLHLFTYFWSSTERDAGTAWRRPLKYNSTVVDPWYSDKRTGFSIRLIKD